MACGYIPSCLVAVMEVPGFVVHPVKRESTGLYPSCSCAPLRGYSVKTANLGRWFPPWTVSQASSRPESSQRLIVFVSHIRFFESVGAPESARLLDRPPAEWSQLMGRRDATIASNLTVIVMALHRMSLEVFESLLAQEFPTGAVEAAALGPRVHRASAQMAAMGLWRAPVDPIGAEPILLHCDVDCLGCPSCSPQPSG